MFFRIHPENPQQRLVDKAAALLDKGKVIIYPTDTVYGIGCDAFNKRAIGRVHQLKRVDRKKPMSIICPDLSVLSEYASGISTSVFRSLKRLTPGPYTFILEASTNVPRMMLTKQRTIGIRIPDSPICKALVTALGRPILSTSITLEDELHVVEDPEDIFIQWRNRVDLVVDGGILVTEPSTVVDFTNGYPEILRVGKGDISSLV